MPSFISNCQKSRFTTEKKTLIKNKFRLNRNHFAQAKRSVTKDYFPESHALHGFSLFSANALSTVPMYADEIALT